MEDSVYIPTPKQANKRGISKSIDKQEPKESDIQRDIKTYLQYKGV